MTALLATAPLGVGSTSAVGSPLPAPEQLSANLVAVVSHVPLSVGRVTRAEFQRALAQQVAMAGGRSAPKPGGRRHQKLREAAIGELLDSVWIKGQAAMMGIGVSRHQVASELASIKRENFKSEAEYRRFLKQSRFTQRDVFERVELQLLSVRIQERVARGTNGNRDAQQKLAKFVAAYLDRWRARTVCAEGFAVDRCSNGPPPAS